MINRRVLMSDARHFTNEQPINPYYHKESINEAKAIAEHKHIKALLEDAGIEVISVPSPKGCQDGVYTANWGLVRGDKAVLARLPNARKAEESHAREILESLGKTVYEIPEGLKFSGQGDALPCGDLLFCGSGYRSDPATQAFAAETLGFTRIQLQTIPQLDESGNPRINASSGWPDSFFYDIDLALAILKGPENSNKGIIAYCPDAFTPESKELLATLTEVDKIEVSLYEAKEAFACNLVSTGNTVIMSARAPELTAKLREIGMTVFSPDITELAKGGGYIRCTTLTLD